MSKINYPRFVRGVWTMNAAGTLDRDGRAGRLVKVRLVSDSDVPTVAAYKGSLYLPNARFGNARPATAAYWISRIDK